MTGEQQEHAAQHALVDLARRGDAEAWRALYLRHHHRILAWLRSLPTGDPATGADDICAEAWTVAAGKMAEFRGTDDDFGGWLLGIARNIATNTRRRSVRRQTYATEDAGVAEVAADQLPDAAVSAADSTRRLLAQLSPREAEVVACIDVAGLDVAATARALGMSTTAVRVARHRALGRLRTVLAAERDT